MADFPLAVKSEKDNLSTPQSGSLYGSKILLLISLPARVTTLFLLTCTSSPNELNLSFFYYRGVIDYVLYFTAIF